MRAVRVWLVLMLTAGVSAQQPAPPPADNGPAERDRLHPTLKGYQIWADALKPIFHELLGAPAPTDLAPPPTGDPSAARRVP